MFNFSAKPPVPNVRVDTQKIEVMNCGLDGLLAVRQSLALGQQPQPDILLAAQNSLVDALAAVRSLRG